MDVYLLVNVCEEFPANIGFLPGQTKIRTSLFDNLSFGVCLPLFYHTYIYCRVYFINWRLGGDGVN